MIKTNLNEVSRKMDRLINRLTSTTLKQALHLALQVVGFRAVSEHMVQTGSIAAAAEMPTDPEKLTIRTGRLSGSLVSAPRFSVADLPTGMEMRFMGMKKGITISRLGGVQESINEVSRSGLTFVATKGSKVPYALKHEKGTGIRARPFLEPAAKESQNDILEIMERTIIHQGRVHGF